MIDQANTQYNEALQALKQFVTLRQKALQLTRKDLFARLKPSNLGKTAQRLDSFLAHEINYKRCQDFLPKLAVALSESSEEAEHITAELERLVEQRRQAKTALEQAHYVANFKPHAYLVGSYKRPSQITFFAMTGGSERWLKISLDELGNSQSPEQAIAEIVAYLKENPTIMFWGAATGFYINYTPEKAVHYDLNGKPVKEIEGNYHPGDAVFSIR